MRSLIVSVKIDSHAGLQKITKYDSSLICMINL